MSREIDRRNLLEALELARGSFGLSDPNPRVGCLIGDAAGRLFGRGATQQAGGPHAEVVALRDALAHGAPVRGATAWVTLEPCSHFGRTPPCCDALIDAGIARCVVAARDPNPEVAGSGLARMRAAGIEVDLDVDADLAAEARAINIGFFSRMERARPWVRLKLATTLDGRSALADGRSRWITGSDARADGHLWRKRASAVLTGIGTVLADDPRLDVRAVSTARQPLRIVLDRRLRTPVTAAILRPPGSTLIVAAPGAPGRRAGLEQAGAEVWDDWDDEPASQLPALLRRLAARGVNELHVEAGPLLSGAFIASGLADELLVYLAPSLIGPGRPIAALPALDDLEGAHRFAWLTADRVGSDLRVRLVRR